MTQAPTGDTGTQVPFLKHCTDKDITTEQERTFLTVSYHDEPPEAGQGTHGKGIKGEKPAPVVPWTYLQLPAHSGGQALP